MDLTDRNRLTIRPRSRKKVRDGDGDTAIGPSSPRRVFDRTRVVNGPRRAEAEKFVCARRAKSEPDWHITLASCAPMGDGISSAGCRRLHAGSMRSPDGTHFANSRSKFLHIVTGLCCGYASRKSSRWRGRHRQHARRPHTAGRQCAPRKGNAAGMAAATRIRQKSRQGVGAPGGFFYLTSSF